MTYPREHAQLLALPGIGEYTAAAVASFAYGQRHAVLDTNVRRVFARAVTGVQYPPNATTAAERKLARALLPEDERHRGPLGGRLHGAGRAGLHRQERELRALSRSPRSAPGGWRASPRTRGPARRGQTYAGTDRQVRGKLLAVLREAVAPVPQAALDRVWDEPVQRARALDGLVADGLVEPLPAACTGCR